MQAVSLSVCRSIKLEKPKFNGAFCKSRMVIQHVVATVIVMVAASVGSSVFQVPNVCNLAHRCRLFPVDHLQKIWIYCPAIPAHAVMVKVQCLSNQAFMACHNVCQIPQGLWCMPLCSNVDVYSASSGCIAFGSCFSKESDNLLQGWNILIGKDRGYHFAFMCVIPANGNVLLEFPFPSLSIPCAPGAVTVSSGCILVASCSKVGGCFSGCCLSGDVVHLNLNSDGLFFHFCDLICCFFVHCLCTPFRFVFPFGVHIFALKQLNWNTITGQRYSWHIVYTTRSFFLIRTHIKSHQKFCENLCVSGLF